MKKVIFLFATFLLASQVQAAPPFTVAPGCNFDAGAYTQTMEGATVGDVSSSIDLIGLPGFYVAMARPASMTARVQILWSHDDTLFTPGIQFAEFNLCIPREARYVKFKVLGRSAQEGLDLFVASGTGVVTTGGGGAISVTNTVTVTDTTYDRSVTNTVTVTNTDTSYDRSITNTVSVTDTSYDRSITNTPGVKVLDESGTYYTGVTGPAAVWATTPVVFDPRARLYITADQPISVLGSPAGDHGAKDIPASATEIIAANTNRKSIMIKNIGPDVVVIGNSDLTFNTVDATDGIPLAGGTVEHDGTGNFIVLDWTTAIYGFGTGASSKVSYIEELKQ